MKLRYHPFQPLHNVGYMIALLVAIVLGVGCGNIDEPAGTTEQALRRPGASARISAGCEHSLAINPNGMVYAWGENGSGQLGDGTTRDRYQPVSISSTLPQRVIAVAAGCLHSLALAADGTVWAWGDNTYGALGDGTNRGESSKTKLHTRPVQVLLSATPSLPLTGIIAIAAGTHQSFAVRVDGSVWAWGYNNDGSLGDNTSRNNRLFAVQVMQNVAGTISPLNNIVAIATGLTEVTTKHGTGKSAYYTYNDPGQTHTLALKADGTVWGWGDNSWGQVGDSTRTFRSAAVQVYGIRNATAIAAGFRHSVALLADGTLTSWGSNSDGQLGNGASGDTPSPLSVSLPSNVIITSVVAGAYHTSALTADGRVYAWGRNDNGQLGIYSVCPAATKRPSQRAPMPMSNAPTNGTALAAGRYHTLIVAATGEIWGTGRNASGQLGDNSTTTRCSPVRASLRAGILRFAAGQDHSLFLRPDGTVWAAGNNTYGQIGDRQPTGGILDYRLTPVQVKGPAGVGYLSDIIAVEAGDGTSLALASSGNVYAWGNNRDGQLGDGTNENRPFPVQLQGLNNIVAIKMSLGHVLALRADGTVYAWGRNDFGQVGDGIPSSVRNQPSQVRGIGQVVAIAAGDGFSLAVQHNGTLWAWGNGSNGQFCDSGVLGGPIRTIPTQIPNLNTLTNVAAGSRHSLLLDAAGHVWACGANDSGQLGNNSTILSAIPVRVLVVDGVTTQIEAKENTSTAMTFDGKIYTWGYNGNGLVGDRTMDNKWIPTLPYPETPLGSVMSRGLGWNHTIIGLADGSICVWGRNVGQFGDGTYGSMRLTPACFRLP